MTTTDCIQNLSTVAATTMRTINCEGTTVNKSTESGNSQTFKDLLLQLIEKDELHFAGWAILIVLVLLIITCCIGCKGCCCRACCGSRETRFSTNTCKLPGLCGGGGHGHDIQGLPKEVAVVPITRCCYHPHHCTIDIERPFVCDCRRVCKTCRGYFPTSAYSRPKPAVDREDTSRSPSPEPKVRKVKTENGEKSPDGPPLPQQPYHRVEVDKMPGKKASSSTTAKQVRPKGPAPTAPAAPEVGFNYRLPPGAWSYIHPNSPSLNSHKTSAMGFVDPKQSAEAWKKPKEQDKPKEEDQEEQWD